MGSKEDWILVAKKELGVKTPFETLTKSWDQFEIQPYYTKSDLRFNINRLPVRLVDLHADPNHWFNLPEVDCSAADSNSKALDHLQNGADGVFFKVDDRCNPQNLLSEIKPEFCFLGFESDVKSISFFERLSELFPPEGLNGTIFWEPQLKWLPVASLFKGYSSFRCLGITETGSGATQQVFSCLKEAIDVLDLLTDYAFSPKSVFNQLAFTIHATPHFFGDVVKIRALRILLDRLSMAYGLESASSFIRIKINPAVADPYQPHGDLLGNSFSTVAAIASSADAITVKTVNDQSVLHNRTARNVSLLMKEESRLEKVIDPFSGSYFIESLTHSLVEKVWTQVTAK